MGTRATACGKAILLGEHAVVYGQPAIAVPVSDVRAAVEITDLPGRSGIQVVAHDLGLTFALQDIGLLPAAAPLQRTLCNTLDFLGMRHTALSCRIAIRSQVPVARGMGSGTAVATALVRGLADYAGRSVGPEDVSRLVYQTEILLHGTPSGIDNTVVAYEQPVYFVKGERPQTVGVGAPLTLVIGDTGVPAETKAAVVLVRERLEREPARNQRILDEIGDLVVQARQAMADGKAHRLGLLMDENQELLASLGVSSPDLQRLIDAARLAGAWGAKLSGGGMGGCMIAVCSPALREAIEQALWNAGAFAVFTTRVA